MSEFIGRCDHLRCQDLEEYDDTERTITNRTFRKLVGREMYLELEQMTGYDRHLRLANDWHVSYGRGKWKGNPCACLHWSSYHHIITL